MKHGVANYSKSIILIGYGEIQHQIIIPPQTFSRLEVSQICLVNH